MEKGEVVPLYAKKAYWESRNVDTFFLTSVPDSEE